MAVPIALAVGFTVYVIIQGIDRGVLFLLRTVFGGFAVIFLARRQAERSARRRDTQ